MTWQEYETGLEGRLIDLYSRVYRGAYRAQPSRRVYIPKTDGRQRPLGIAALEDKIVQQAAVTILNQIYEVNFKGFSDGFCPGRSLHQAKRMVAKLKAIKIELRRRMHARPSEVGAWLRKVVNGYLPIPGSARESSTAEHLPPTYQSAVVPGTSKPQPACPQNVGATHSVIRTVDTTP